jgi:hypothetical protein
MFCGLSAGFYGAIVQSLREAEPEWLTAAFVSIVVPAIFQVLEYLVHWFRGTPHLRLAEVVSLLTSALSGLFNWYAMRRGTLLVGRAAPEFSADLKTLPRLVIGFVALLPRRLLRRLHAGQSNLVFAMLFGSHHRGR